MGSGVNTVMNFLVPLVVRNFLRSCATISFSIYTMLHGFDPEFLVLTK
jgi:hypothetical protein